MEKKFWVCKIAEEPVLGFAANLEFAMAFDKRKDAEKYIKTDGDLYPSSRWIILEVWQEEVK